MPRSRAEQTGPKPGHPLLESRSKDAGAVGLLALALVLAGAGDGRAAPHGLAAADTPCWLFAPSTVERTGSVGISRTVTMGTDPVTLARHRAARGLIGRSAATELPRSAVAELSRKRGARLTAAGQAITFADRFRSGGYVFAYATTGGPVPDALREPCPDRAALAVEACQPGWVCSPSTDSSGGVVGISERTTRFPSQIQAAIDNALRYLRYAYGVTVAGKEAVLRQASRLSKLTLHVRDFDVGEGAQVPEEVALRLRELRFDGSRLYIWLTSPDLPPQPKAVRAHKQAWRTQPAPPGVFGVLGSAERPWDGRLSTQLEAAIRNGLISFAKAREAQVTGMTTLRQTETGTAAARQSLTQVQQQVRARLLGLHITDDNRLLVWLGQPTGGATGSAPTSKPQGEGEES